MAHIHEYKCGCMIHSLAGAIRKCSGTVKRSLSGRMKKSEDGNEQSHNRSIEAEPVRTYEVAEILP